MKKILEWIKLVWWAIRNKPIIHNVIFRGGITLDKDNCNVLVLKDMFGKIK